MFNTFKKKLLIIVGAGGSVEFGMPCVSRVNQILSDALNQYIYIKDSPMSLYQWIQDLAPTIDFEEILYRFSQLESLLSSNNALNPLIDNSLLPQITNVLLQKEGSLNSDALRISGSMMHDSLVNEFRNRARSLLQNHSHELNKAQEFFKQLGRHFSIGVINLNYDNVLLHALDFPFTGFDRNNGSFLPNRVLNRRSYNFLYHLHGSVHFDLRGSRMNMHEIYWNNDLEGNFSQNSAGRSSDVSMEQFRIFNSAFIAGYGKNIQLQRYPFRIYYSMLDKLIERADSILFIGYGFKDEHLNSAFHRVRSDKKKIAVITRSDDNTNPMAFRSDEWSTSFLKTVHANSHDFNASNGRFRPLVRDLRPNALERSTNPEYPRAIWHHGFLKACDEPDAIMRELK
jgi:hypothetical protein